MYEKRMKTNSLSYIVKGKKSKLALAVFLLIFSGLFLSLAQQTNSWSLASENYSSSLTVITGGGVTDTTSDNFSSDIAVAQSITGSTNSSLFSTMLGFFFSSIRESSSIPQTPPTNPSVSLNATSVENSSSDNLTVNISGSTDANGDKIWNVTDWRRESVSIAVLNLPFDLDNNSVAKDYSTYSNNGTVNGATWVSSGKVGGAYEFNGNGDVVDIPNLMLYENYTISWWSKVMTNSPASPTGSMVFGYGNDNNNFIYTLDGTRVRYKNNIAVTVDWSLDTDFYNKWRHFTLVAGTNSVRLYIDGSSQGDRSLDPAFKLYDIGTGYTTASYDFIGYIDEFIVFNQTMSNEQVNELYLAGYNNHSLQKIVSNETSVGENWSVAVTANDGIGESDEVISNIVGIELEQTPPSNPTVTLNATSAGNYSSDDLNVNISGSSDEDGDKIWNVTDWRRESVSIAVVNLPFDLNDSSTAKDYSTYDNNGTVNGATWTSDGKVGGAYEFNGVSDNIEISRPLTNAQEQNMNFTVSVWAKFNEFKGAWQVVANQGNLNDLGQFWFIGERGTANEVCFAVGSYANDKSCISTSSLSAGQWHHFVGVHKYGESITLYVDGSAQTPDTSFYSSFTNTSSYDIRLGKTSYTNAFYMNGSVDGFEYYNYSLSAEQVNESYLAGYNNHSLKKIVSNETEIGENWSVAVTANDGFGESDTVISNVVKIELEQTPPSNPTVVLNATSAGNYSSDNLTVNISGSTDENGDKIWNVTDWRKEGVSIAVLNLPFDLNNDSVAKDYSTYSNNGTVNGATWVSSGKVGGAYEFNGVDDYINFSGADLDNIHTLSWELWVKRNDIGRDTILIKGGDTTADKLLEFQSDDTIRAFARTSSTAADSQSSNAVTDTDWHHIIITYNNTGDRVMRIYFDGSEVTYDTQPTATGTMDDDSDHGFYIAKRPSGVGGIFNGKIDDVKIYDFVLSEEQINESYLAGYNNHSLKKIVSNETSVGENWSVAVTANDGIGESDEVISNGVEILNSPPSNPTVVLNATSSGNYSSDNLTVWINGSSDENGDKIWNVTDWRKEGVSIAVVNLPFDLNDSSTAKDYSTYDNNGTVNGATWTSDGKVGGAYEFNGVSDNIEISRPLTNAQEQNMNFTVSVWAKFNEFKGAWQVVANQGDLNSGGNFWFLGERKDFGQICFAVGAWSQDYSCISTGDLNTDEWYHLVGVHKYGERITLYVNGNSRPSDTSLSTGFTNTSIYNIRLGKTSYTNAYYLNGSLDGFGYYNYSLSTEQINELYLAGYNNHSLQKIVSNETSVGENWSVAVTANDGIGESDEVISNGVEILNSPPSNPTVVLNATSSGNYSSDNLTVWINGSVDDNGDKIWNVTDWRKEGVSIAVVNLPFDLNNDSVAKDYSTYSNNGTVNGATWVSSGKVGGGYNFTTAGDNIDIANYELYENYTISWWSKVMTATPGDATDSMVFGDGSDNNNFVYTSDGLRVRFENFYGSNVGWEGDSDFYNRWRHFTLVAGVNTIRLYIDGENQGDNPINTRFQLYEIGAGHTTSSYDFMGYVDEFALFNHTLSSEQVNEIYLAGYNNHSLQKIVSNETSVGENWSVAVTANDGIGESDEVISNGVEILENQAPSKVVLVSPENGSDTSINRTQILNWSAATDPEDDPLTYELNATRITFDGEPDCSVNSIYESGISILNYTTQELCVDDWYEWKVRAYDGQNYGEWSDVWNFSVQSYISVNMVQSDVNFTGLYVGESANTSSNSANALKIENAGNVPLNFTIYGNDSLWVRTYAHLNTSYFQFKANYSDDEASGFENSSSQMDWMNVTDYEINLLNLLDYNNTQDTALIDVLVEVPEDEPGGDKDSILMIMSSWG